MNRLPVLLLLSACTVDPGALEGHATGLDTPSARAELDTGDPGPAWVVAFIDAADDDDRLERWAGPLGVLEIVGDLDNPALPDATVPVDAARLIVAPFDEAPDAEDRAWDIVEAHPSADVWIGAMPPGFDVFPAPEALAPLPDDAFVLVNAITLDPYGFPDFEAYSDAAVPLAMAAGTRFAAPLAPTVHIAGAPPPTFLSLTHWASAEAFHDLHQSEAFLDIVGLRNGAVVGFVEAQARPLPAP